MSSSPSSEPTSDGARETSSRTTVQGAQPTWAWAFACGWAVFVWGLGGDGLSLASTSRFLGPLIAWLLPDVSVETSDWLQLMIRKAAHVTEYGLLAFLVLRAFVAGGRPALGAAALAAFCLATTFAAADETRQSLSATRLGSVWDVALDAVGAFSGVGLLLLLRVWLPELADWLGLFGPRDQDGRGHSTARSNKRVTE